MLLLVLLASALAGTPIYLRDALALAETAPSGRAALATVEAERAMARSLAAPSGNPGVELSQDPDERDVTLDVPVDLAWLGRLSAAREAGDLAELHARAARVNVAVEAGEVWLEARAALDRAEVAEHLEATARRAAEAAAARAAAGEIGADEAALLRADAAAALGRARDARAVRETSLRRLEVLLGVSPNGQSELGHWTPIPDPPTVDSATLPLVLEAETRARQASAEARLAGLERLPEVELSGGWVDGDVDGPAFGVRLELPLFAPRAAPHAAARAEADAASAEAESQRLGGTATLDAATRELAVATELVSAWEGANLGTALDAATRRYEAGEIGPGEALARRAVLADALDQQIDARLRLERARLRLWALAGQIPWEKAP